MSASLTVADLWALAFPQEAILVGGRGGLARPVEWVTRLRPAFPLFPELGEGYLVMASPRVAQELDPRLTLDYLMRELARMRAAGLVIDEPASPEGIALADALDLPLFCLPSETDLHALEREALRTLVDRQGQAVRREAEMRERYQQVFAEGGTLAVLESLARALRGLVELCDLDGTLMARAGITVGAPAEGLEEKTFPIVVGGRLLGHLRVKAPRDIPSSSVALAARPAAEVCGIEMLRQAMREEAEAELGTDLVEQILASSLEVPALVARLRRLGYDPSPGRQHVVFALGEQGSKGTTYSLGEALARDLAWVVAREGASAIALPYREGALCFLSFLVAAGERNLRSWLHQILAKLPKVPCALGISRAVEGLPGLREAIEQATAALALGQRIEGLSSPYFYDDLGLYRLLATLSGGAELQRFYEETLGTLVAYDEAHGTEFVFTLKTFFEQNATAAQTARVLNVHRNTLHYRLERIIEITGLDLNDPEARLALQLALKVRHLAK